MELKNKKHELFCNEYIKDLNATRAYQRSYEIENENSARKAASRLLTRVDIENRIQELMRKRTRRIQRDADDILKDIIEVKSRCMQQIPVMEKVDGEYRETGEWKFDSNGALKALELEGKHQALFTDKMKLDGKVKNETEITVKSVDLEERVKQLEVKSEES